MGDSKNVQAKDSKNPSQESQLGECDSFWIVSGPPYDQRDYMISPSGSSTSSSLDDLYISKEKHFDLGDVKVDEKYILDSRKALKKIVELIRNGCIHLFTARIKNLIVKYLEGCCSGFPIDDVPLIVEVLEYFSRNKECNSKYTEFVNDLIKVAENPPIVQKSSNILKSKRCLTEYFTVLGELLASFEENEIQNHLLQSIESLIYRRKLPNDSAVKLSLCQEAMEESLLPYVVAVLVGTVSQDLYIRYLDCIIYIILVSVKAGLLMIQRNVLHFLLWRLNFCTIYNLSTENPKNAKEEAIINDYYTLLEKSSYAIWGLLSIICKCEVEVPCPGEDAMISLKIVFERESVKKSQKALSARNNLAGLMVKLCAIFGETLPLYESGLAVDMAVMAVGTEMGHQDTWITSCDLSTKKEDFLLKKLMVLGCCLIVRQKKCLEVLKSLKMIEGMLCLLDPEKMTSWIPSQFINLFYMALRCLSLLVPLLPDVFILNNGTVSLLSVMKWSVKNRFDQDTLLEILETISIILTGSASRCIINDIVAKDGVNLFLDLCSYILNFKSIKLKDQNKLTRLFFILEKILKDNDKLLIKCGDSCASLIISLLKRILNDSASDSKWNPLILVSFSGFIWETVAWCSSSRSLFIDKGGIFLLLDVLERSVFPVQMLFLGILVDMTDDGKSVSHLNVWRGKNGFGILDLLIDIWRKEESITRVKRTKEGVIQDVEMPLMTEEQWYLTHQIRGSHRYSPSIAEMYCSSRPKVFALYHFLRKKYSDWTNLSESFYSLYLKNVRPTYKFYVPLIEHFLTLKMGEVWFEVLRDATLSGVFLLADDGDALCTLLDEKNKWSTRIKTMQEEIRFSQRMNNAAEEGKLYEVLKSNEFASSLEALGELDYVARTSVKKFQEEKKKKQISDVENSLKKLSVSPNSNFHRTFTCKTKATCFSGSYVKVKSEKEVAEIPDIVIISSDESGDDKFELSD